MLYKVIDNFLNENQCEELIKNAEEADINQNNSRIHGNRQVIPNTSLNFLNLEKKFFNWRSLSEKINCNKFFEFCLNELNLKNDSFEYKKFFKKDIFNSSDISYKKLAKLSVRTISTKSLIKIVLYRYLKYFNRYFFIINDFFSKKKSLELLFDYSKSGNGYEREIHRDSDSRYLVFLLYLNNLDSEGIGGDLDIYKLKNENVEKKLAQPEKNNCELVESISPKAGRLVLFLNDETSYHAVKKMENSKTYRHFLYGGFTLLGKKNPLLKKTNNMKTNFDLYL